LRLQGNRGVTVPSASANGDRLSLSATKRRLLIYEWMADHPRNHDQEHEQENDKQDPQLDGRVFLPLDSLHPSARAAVHFAVAWRSEIRVCSRHRLPLRALAGCQTLSNCPIDVARFSMNGPPIRVGGHLGSAAGAIARVGTRRLRVPRRATRPAYGHDQRGTSRDELRMNAISDDT
jgi:hypothetical protein